MPRIRPFRPGDEAAVADICLKTADAGADATGVFDDDAIWAEVFVLPYVHRHPDLAFVVETERRFYLANQVEVHPRDDGWVEVVLADAWVWDMFRPARFVSNVRVMTRRDVNVEELRPDDSIRMPS